MSITVHRAGVVYSPRFAVLVNPPDPAIAARLRAGGGGARALDWVLNGMSDSDPTQGRQTLAGFLETLRQSGISEATARELAQQAADRGEIDAGDPASVVALPSHSRDHIYEEALSLAAAAAGGRVRIGDMITGTTPPLRTLYEGAYVDAVQHARLASIELLPNFPVATVAFGYTRAQFTPGASRLVPFRERGHICAYGTLSRTEALLFQLDPLAVHENLRRQGFDMTVATTSRDARISLLNAVNIPHPTEEHPQPLGAAVIKLLHSYAHRTIRRMASFSGIERDALAEYLLPHHLSFVVYAASRGDFVLGGLQALFETDLHRFLNDLVNGEARCPLDPGCRSGGGACMACLHLGEPSCRWFNRFLDRSVLFGRTGFIVSN